MNIKIYFNLCIMNYFYNTLPPRFRTWAEFYAEVNKAGLIERLAAELEEGEDLDLAILRLKILVSERQNPGEQELYDDYQFSLGFVKARYFDELYAALPTKETKNDNRKRVYHLKSYNTTILQNLVDFINSIPTK